MMDEIIIKKKDINVEIIVNKLRKWNEVLKIQIISECQIILLFFI